MLSFNITILYQKSKRAYSVREHRAENKLYSLSNLNLANVEGERVA